MMAWTPFIFLNSPGAWMYDIKNSSKRQKIEFFHDFVAKQHFQDFRSDFEKHTYATLFFHMLVLRCFLMFMS